MYYIMIGAIIFVIGICLIIAGFIINDDTAIVLIAWGLAGVFAGALIIVITLMDKGVNGNKTINENSTEIETVAETQSVKCNGMDVAKISDTQGKGMCKNPEYVEYLQRCIDWRMKEDR